MLHVVLWLDHHHLLHTWRTQRYNTALSDLFQLFFFFSWFKAHFRKGNVWTLLVVELIWSMEKHLPHFCLGRLSLWDHWTETQCWWLRCNTPRSRWCRCPQRGADRCGLWTPGSAQSRCPRWPPGWAGPSLRQHQEGWTSHVDSRTLLLFPEQSAPPCCLDWMIDMYCFSVLCLANLA